MPILKRKRILAAKIETTPGTAETLAAADGAMNIFDAMIQNETEVVQREGQGGFSPLPAVLAAYAGRATFKTHLIGGGSAGTSPLWATALLPACGFKNTAGTFTPSSEGPGSNVKTVTLALYIDGLKKTLRGCMGNCKFTMTAGRPVEVEFDFRGIWVDPIDASALAPTYPTTAPLRFASSGLTLAAAAIPPVRQFTIDFGNEVALREDSQDASGLAYAVVTGRRVNGTLDPESALVASHDVFGIFKAGTEKALAISLGSANNIVSFAAPKLQFLKPEEADRNGVQCENVPYQLNRSVSAGDDELSIDVQVA